jgi:LacI family transcriptional regulator
MLLEMRALQTAGVILLGAVKSPGLELSLKAGEPLVFVNRRSPFPMQGPFIGIDNALAGRIVAKHFAGCGHTNVWIFHSSLASSAARERVAAFRSKFRALAGPGSLVRDVTVSTRRMESAYERAKELLMPDDPPHAVFCTTDEIAYGVARRCFEMGLQQPHQVMIFGFDGNPLNDYLAPWLSTIQVPYEDFGPTVVATLDAMWSHRDGRTPPDHILPFRTIIARGAHPPAALVKPAGRR